MSAIVPPAPSIPPATVHDVSHPAAVASGAPATIAPSLLQDVSHPAAVPPAAVAPVGPVTASDPLPVPTPAAVTRTPLTVAPPPTAPENSPTAGIAPVSIAVAPPHADPAIAPVAPVAPVTTRAPAADPVAPVVVPVPAVTDADSHTVTLADTQIAGGVPVPPVVSLPAVQNPQSAAHQAEAAASVRKLAARNGIDLASVTGTGAGGKVLGKDVKAAIAAKNATDEIGSAASDDDQPSPVADDAEVTPAAPVPAGVAATAPALVPSPAGAASLLTAAGAPVESTVTLRLNIAQRDDRTLSITSSDQLAAMAANALPGLMVISAALELSAQGPVLLAEVASTAAVEL